VAERVAAARMAEREQAGGHLPGYTDLIRDFIDALTSQLGPDMSNKVFYVMLCSHFYRLMRTLCVQEASGARCLIVTLLSLSITLRRYGCADRALSRRFAGRACLKLGSSVVPRRVATQRRSPQCAA